MKLLIGPIDVVGNLWVIRPEVTAARDIEWQRVRSSVELRVTCRAGVEAAAAKALFAGQTVGIFERARAFTARVARLSEQLAELGAAAEWVWTDSTTTSVRVDEERDALAWFVQHPTEVLLVDPVAFEKRRRLAPPAFPRRRAASLAAS